MHNRQEAQLNLDKTPSLRDRIARKYELTPTISLILGVTTLFFALFLIYPLLYVFKEAFWIENKFNIAYFKLMITDPNIRGLIINSLTLGLTVTLMTSIVSLPLAYFLTRYRYPGRNMLRALILIPMIMPPFVGAIGMQEFFGKYGSINMFLIKLKLMDIANPIDWFARRFLGSCPAVNFAPISNYVLKHRCGVSEC